MSKKILLNYLELAWSPICNYDFARLKQDEYFQKALSESHIYFIAQRRELFFNEFKYRILKNRNILLEFEIHQKNNPVVLKCATPIYQKYLVQDIKREVNFHINYTYPKPTIKETTPPYNNVRECFIIYHDGTFATWISPENYLYRYLMGGFAADIDGDIGEFIKYKVHYCRFWRMLTHFSELC